MSQAREKLAVLDKETLTDAEAIERDGLVTGYPELEKRYQAAVIVETTENVQADGEAKETAAIETRASIETYVAAALLGNTLEGAEAEFNAAHGLETRSAKDGSTIMPMAMLAPLETRADASTNLAADTALPTTGTPWLERLFAESWIGWSGITTRKASGEVLHTKITAGADADTKAKEAKVETDAMTISTIMATPTRVTGAYRCSGVDELRTRGMLGNALNTDLRRVLVDKIEALLINATASANTFDGLAAAVTASPDAALAAATGAPALDGFFATAIDGLTATMWSDIRVLCRPEFYAALSSMLTTGGDTFWLGEWRSRGLDFRSTNHVKSLTAGDSYMYTFGQRAINNALILDQWTGVEIMRDPYTLMQNDQVTLVAKTYVDFNIQRASHVNKHRVAVK